MDWSRKIPYHRHGVTVECWRRFATTVSGIDEPTDQNIIALGHFPDTKTKNSSNRIGVSTRPKATFLQTDVVVD
jgi:hypothetical protein